MIAHVQIRATHGDLLEDERLNKLRELCEELGLFNETTIDGWTISVESAVEAQCVYEGFAREGVGNGHAPHASGRDPSTRHPALVSGSRDGIEANEDRPPPFCPVDGELRPSLQSVRCPEAATEIVGGSELCPAHAKGARRLMAALERTA